MNLNLKTVKNDTYEYCDRLLIKDGSYGCYRNEVGKRPDLYSTVDIAQIRAIMGEDLMSLPEDKRKEWIDHINSYADLHRNDGSYSDTLGHAPLHANGMVIGALSVLGGKQLLPVKLYEEFNTVEKVPIFLENLDWADQWGASHLFWGGMHYFSFSKKCTKEWIKCVIDWLNSNIDENTGWWRKGIPHCDRRDPLGGSVHILPIYEHHKYAFPYPERVIDSVLNLQLPEGNWFNKKTPYVMHYLELDALYALKYMQSLVPEYRKDDINRCIKLYGDLVIDYYTNSKNELFKLHPHMVLAAVGTFGLLQYFHPDRFNDDIHWSDIFSDLRFYNTASVEVV